ncbi:hypothetical protein EWM64_g8510 [Hericium alpestre]|uniref:Tudor domain-containing protein n=1 Tax=Hericium alpestre TaxID=135208 RepID=A0A4Y9ZMM8_9AGAM|nr:hypothetical protein EWM64_g8510 [Hericium alpestre]
MLRGLMERAWSPVGAARRAPPSSKFAIDTSHLAYVRYFHRTPIEADFGLLPDTHSWHRKDLPTVMEKLRQTHTNISDLFSRLAVEKASLDSALQRCAERDVQDHELLSAVSDFAERQRRVEDDVRGLLDRQSESDEVLEEGMMRLFKEKTEKNQRCRREIEGLFEESVRGAQEIEQLLRRFDIAVLPADGSANPGLIFLTPSSPPDIPEVKPKPQEWDFFTYDQDVSWGSGGAPQIKPPSPFIDFCESEVTTFSDPLRFESVHRNVGIPIPTWTEDRIREIKVNGIRIPKYEGAELSVRIVDSSTEPGALEELTQNLTKYHRETIHKLADNYPSGFVAIQSSHGKAWHRGKILQVHVSNHGCTAEVRFIDFGFHETQALQARLSFVELVGPPTQHYTEALEALQKACAGRTLMAKLDYNDSGTLHMRLLNPGCNPDNISASINVQLLQGGLAVLSDSPRYPYTYADRAISRLLATIVISARNQGVGIYRRKEAAL